MDLPVLKLNDAAVLPTRAHPGDAGLDLYSTEEAHMGPGERWGVGTGIAVEIPEGQAGVLLTNTDPAETVRIEAGARIAQLVLTPVVAADAVEATALSESARGDGGFGSSGR